MKKLEPLVSIITPTYNSLPYIKETYNGIKEQSFQNWEWVVTDDVSTDGTYEYLTELVKTDNRIHLFRNEINSGAAKTRNTCISNSNGRYIAFLDSDDLWDKDKLTDQISYMKKNKASFSFTAYRVLVNDEMKERVKVMDSKNIALIRYSDLLKKKVNLGCSTVVLDSRIIKNIQMPSLVMGEDYALWLKILRSGINAFHLNKVYTSYRKRPGSLSSNKALKSYYQWKTLRYQEGMNILNTLYYFMYYAVRGIYRI